jgi:outer membrane protein W
MNPSTLLFAVALLAPSQNPQQPPQESALIVDANVKADAQRQQPQGQRQQPQGEEDRRPLSVDRNHAVGFGGQVSVSNSGVGAGTRLFFSERLGVNLNAFWYNSSPTGYGPSQGSTYGAVPSVMYMFSNPASKDVDIRPYVGGGMSYISSSRPITTGNVTSTERFTGVGGQVFGGVEMTFREVDFMTISAEGIYYRLPVAMVNTSMMDGMNWLMAVHFFVK